MLLGQHTYLCVILCVGEIMPRGKAKQDSTMLQMALVGYEFEKRKIDDKIREIRAALGGKQAPKETASAEGDGDRPKRRKLSAAARKRISAAQKKRWAEQRKGQSA